MLKNCIKIVMVLLLMMSFTAFAEKGEEKISFEALPKSVQKLPYDKIIAVEKEVKKKSSFTK